MSRKRFGQHFLADEGVIAHILRVVAIRESDVVLEIGPGRGALTEGLLDSGAQVVAVEIDRDLIASVRARFPSVRLIESDVLDVSSEVFKGKRIVGNLPYNISTPLLLRLVSLDNLLDMHFMLQKEVVDRMTAEPGSKSWGRLSVKVQRCWEIHRHFSVESGAFEPQPKVESSFVRVVPMKDPIAVKSETTFDSVLRMAFSQRRKKIANSLAAFCLQWEKLGISSSKRADQLGVEEYAAIANSLGD